MIGIAAVDVVAPRQMIVVVQSYLYVICFYGILAKHASITPPYFLNNNYPINLTLTLWLSIKVSDGKVSIKGLCLSRSPYSCVTCGGLRPCTVIRFSCYVYRLLLKLSYLDTLHCSARWL